MVKPWGCLSYGISLNSQIHVIQLQLFQACRYRIWNIFNIVHDFGCYKEFVPSNTTFLDCNSKFDFGIVDFSAIQMMVAKFDGCLDSFNSLPIYAAVSRTLIPGSAGWNILRPPRIHVGSTLILTSIAKLYQLASWDAHGVMTNKRYGCAIIQG